MSIQLNLSQIVDTTTVCPYCMNPATGLGCCGESSAHFERAYVTKSDCYLESEVDLNNDIPVKEIEFNYQGDQLRLVFNSNSELLQGLTWVAAIQQDIDITAQLMETIKIDKRLQHKIEIELFELARNS